VESKGTILLKWEKNLLMITFIYGVGNEN